MSRRRGNDGNTTLVKELPKTCKNIDALCAALGIALPAQRVRANKLRELVAGWKDGKALPAGCPPFPERKRGLWPYVAVVEWGIAAGVTNTGKDKWELKPEVRGQKSEVRKPAKTEPLPQQAKPAEGELFQEPGFEQTLDLWQDKLENPLKWQESPIQLWQLKELQRRRPQLFDKKAPGGAGQLANASSENIGGGQDGVAGWINNNYPGQVVNQMTIHRWLKGEMLPPGCKENFPPAEGRGTWKTDKVRAWCDLFLPKQATQQGLAITLQAALDQEKLDEIEHNKWQREMERRRDDANYISIAEALALMHEFYRAIYQTVDRTEKTWPKEFGELLQRSEAGGQRSDAELTEAFRNWLPGQNEALKLQMQRAVEGLEKRAGNA